MSAPDPESFTLAHKVLAAVGSIGGALFGVHKYVDGRYGKKEDVDKCLRHIERLYESAEKDRATTRDLCEGITDKLTDRIEQAHQHLVDLIVSKK